MHYFVYMTLSLKIFAFSKRKLSIHCIINFLSIGNLINVTLSESDKGSLKTKPLEMYFFNRGIVIK